MCVYIYMYICTYMYFQLAVMQVCFMFALRNVVI